MARARTKKYDKGERINVFLSRELTPEFLEWINKQSDLSSFFLYAAQQLYEKTGFVDVAEVMPRKINFHLELNNDNKKEVPIQELPIALKSEESSIKEVKEEEVEEVEEVEEKEYSQWESTEDLDDDYY